MENMVALLHITHKKEKSGSKTKSFVYMSCILFLLAFAVLIQQTLMLQNKSHLARSTYKTKAITYVQ